jgi:hypothetical protein
VEHQEWREKWNRWKYRQVSDEEMSGDKQNLDETSAEVSLKFDCEMLPSFAHATSLVQGQCSKQS